MARAPAGLALQQLSRGVSPWHPPLRVFLMSLPCSVAAWSLVDLAGRAAPGGSGLPRSGRAWPACRAACVPVRRAGRPAPLCASLALPDRTALATSSGRPSLGPQGLPTAQRLLRAQRTVVTTAHGVRPPSGKRSEGDVVPFRASTRLQEMKAQRRHLTPAVFILK